MAPRVLSILRSSLLKQDAVVWLTSRSSACRSFSSESSLSDAQGDALKVGEVGEVSGVPEEHLHRKVVIYSPARTASQQGSAKTGRWKIDFISTQKWENPLMGWTSTGDPYASVGDAALSFNSKEAAIEFAHKYGWEYTVREPKAPVVKVMELPGKPKAYADNYKWKGPEVASKA